jgi:hypothetical protein
MSAAATIIAEYKALLPRTEALVREFQPALSAGAVIGAVTRCRAELRRCGVQRGLAGATEDMARAQLRRRAAATKGTACPRLRPAPGERDGRNVGASGGHGSAGSGLAGHSSRQAPSTAAWSENR